MDTYLNHATFSSSMSSNGRSIQDHMLEVSVVSGHGLKNTEWLGRQDPYVVVKYGDTQYHTKTCTNGGRNPVFDYDKFQFKLIEGLRKFKVVVYNNNSLSAHDVIGYGNVDLQGVLSCGYQEYSCLLTNGTRSAGEIKLILRYPNAQRVDTRNVAPPRSPAPNQHVPCPVPTYYHTPAPRPPCPTYPPQYQPPPPQNQPPTYPPQQNYHHTPPYSNSNVCPPPLYSNSNVYPPPPPNVYTPSAPPVYPPSTYSAYTSPQPSSYYAPPSPYQGCYPPYPY